MRASGVSWRRVLVAGMFLPALALAQQRPAIADQIAKTYGIDSWGQVDAIRYTFALDAGKLKLHRSWSLGTKDGHHHLRRAGQGREAGQGHLFALSAREPERVREGSGGIPSFFNNQYWLLFPFHLIWDTGATIEDAGMQKLPLSKGKARKVVVKYPSSGGYLPGDTWAIFVGKDNRIQQLEFRHRGNGEAGRGPGDLGGLQEGRARSRLDQAPRKG